MLSNACCVLSTKCQGDECKEHNDCNGDYENGSDEEGNESDGEGGREGTDEQGKYSGGEDGEYSDDDDAEGASGQYEDGGGSEGSIASSDTKSTQEQANFYTAERTTGICTAIEW